MAHVTEAQSSARISNATPRLAVWLSCVAGVLFVDLSMSDGHAAVAPHGIDVRLTDEAARNILLVVGLTDWLVGSLRTHRVDTVRRLARH